MNHVITAYEESLQTAKWSLQDLEHIKATKKFNEYITAENIDRWIKGQQHEIESLQKRIKQLGGK